MTLFLRILVAFIFYSSLSACSNFECEHKCGIPGTNTPVTHKFLGIQYNWIMESYLDSFGEGWQHKLTLLNKFQSIDEVSNNYFFYDASIPEGKTTVYRHTVDSIIKLMHDVDSTNSKYSQTKKYTPTKNKQLIMKYFYYTLDVEPIDSMQFASFSNGILNRANNLKGKNSNRWSQRIQDLNALHEDIKDLYQGCSKFEYPENYDDEKDSVAHLYFDKRHSTFIKITYTSNATTQLLFRPTHYILLTRDEEMKENCSCCIW